MGSPLRVFCDFDGSLAEITPRPQDAVPVAGAVSVMEQLSRRSAVAIVSGRRVSFLEQYWPSQLVDLYGLYGLEARVAGVHEMRVDHPRRWTSVVSEAAVGLVAEAPDGVTVEVKGLSLTVHYRGLPAAAGWVLANASQTASRFGLEMRPARMSTELHPPVEIDKGTVVYGASVGLGTSIYVGDDVGDLPAYDALDRLQAQGHEVLRVAVESSESPQALLVRADLILSSPTAVVEFLGDLASFGYRPH